MTRDTNPAPSLTEGEPAPDRLRNPAGPADYDSDPQGGGGDFPEAEERDAPATGGDAKVHGSH